MKTLAGHHWSQQTMTVFGIAFSIFACIVIGYGIGTAIDNPGQGISIGIMAGIILGIIIGVVMYFREE